mmetsp:Transcript_2099/g.5896  ORF Transcript_2099/g.5896 Transcript_2099/m.5896 type:complete len:203 (-) Transcript_2099:312-920(-)
MILPDQASACSALAHKVGDEPPHDRVVEAHAPSGQPADLLPRYPRARSLRELPESLVERFHVDAAPIGRQELGQEVAPRLRIVDRPDAPEVRDAQRDPLVKHLDVARRAEFVDLVHLEDGLQRHWHLLVDQVVEQHHRLERVPLHVCLRRAPAARLPQVGDPHDLPVQLLAQVRVGGPAGQPLVVEPVVPVHRLRQPRPEVA